MVLKRLRIWLYRRREHKHWLGTFSTQRGQGGQAYVPQEFRKELTFKGDVS